MRTHILYTYSYACHQSVTFSVCLSCLSVRVCPCLFVPSPPRVVERGLAYVSLRAVNADKVDDEGVRRLALVNSSIITALRSGFAKSKRAEQSNNVRRGDSARHLLFIVVAGAITSRIAH